MALIGIILRCFKTGRIGLIGVVCAVLVSISVIPSIVTAATDVHIVTIDAIVRPGQPVLLEAFLYQAGVRGMLLPPIPGELLRFYDQDGTLLGEKLTDKGGGARVSWKKGKPGLYRYEVKLSANERYRAHSGYGLVCVREESRPLFFIEVERAIAGLRAAGLLFASLRKVSPLEDAQRIVSSLPVRYQIIYLSSLGGVHRDTIRRWLHENEFPKAPLVVLETGTPFGPDDAADTFEAQGMLRRLLKEGVRSAVAVVGTPFLARTLSDHGVTVFLLSAEKNAGALEPSRCSFEEPCRVGAWKEIESHLRHRKGRSHSRHVVEDIHTNYQHTRFEVPLTCLDKKSQAREHRGPCSGLRGLVLEVSPCFRQALRQADVSNEREEGT